LNHYITTDLGNFSVPEFTFPHPEYTKSEFIKLDKHFGKSLEKFVNGNHGIKSITRSVWDGLERLWILRQNLYYHKTHKDTFDFLINYLKERSNSKSDIYNCFISEERRQDLPWWKELPGMYYP